MPITPEKIVAVKRQEIPDKVIEIFNDLITLGAQPDGKISKVRQDVVVSRILETIPVDRREIFDHNWLDVEGIFADAGWEMVYIKPAYFESFTPYWTLTWKG